MAVDDWRVAQTWRVLQGRQGRIRRNEMCRNRVVESLWRPHCRWAGAGQQKMLAEPLIGGVTGPVVCIGSAAKWAPLARPGKASGGESALDRTNAPKSGRLLGSLELLDVGLKIPWGQLVVDLGLRKGPGGTPGQVLGRGGWGSRPRYGRSTRVGTSGNRRTWTQRLLALDADPAFVRRAGELRVGHLCRGANDTRTSDRYP